MPIELCDLLGPGPFILLFAVIELIREVRPETLELNLFVSKFSVTVSIPDWIFFAARENNLDADCDADGGGRGRW